MGKQSSKRRQNTLSDPASNFPVWHKSIQLIEARKYDEIALLLGELLQKEAVSELDKTLALIFVVAQEISLTCQQIHTEMSLYQQAYEDTVRREAKLQDALRELLEKASKIAAEPSLQCVEVYKTGCTSANKGI